MLKSTRFTPENSIITSLCENSHKFDVMTTKYLEEIPCFFYVLNLKLQLDFLVLPLPGLATTDLPLQVTTSIIQW